MQQSWFSCLIRASFRQQSVGINYDRGMTKQLLLCSKKTKDKGNQTAFFVTSHQFRLQEESELVSASSKKICRISFLGHHKPLKSSVPNSLSPRD